MQNKKRDLNDLLENAQGVNEDEVKVYGADEAEEEIAGEDDMMDLELEPAGDDVEAEVEAEDEDMDVADLIDQLKDVVAELEALETDETEDEGEFGDDDADLEFDAEDEAEDEAEEVEEGSCNKHEDLEEATEMKAAKPKAVAASDAGNVSAEGGKATGPESKEGGSAGKADAAKVEADDEEAIDDTVKAIAGSAKDGRSNPAAKPGKGGEGVKVTQETPTLGVKVESVDFSKEIEAIVGMDSTLSENAQRKTAKLFENAVNKKVEAISSTLEEKYSSALEQRYEELQEGLVEKVDQFLDYVVENYMKDNELAIQEGLKVRVSESFLQGLSNLFESHHVSVPTGKQDLVESLEADIESKEAKNNELYERAIKLRRENIELRKAEALRTVSEGMSEIQKSEFKALAEGVEYKTQAKFAKALNVIKNTHFSGEVTQPAKPDFESLAESTQVSTNSMDKYVRALGRIKS